MQGKLLNKATTSVNGWIMGVGINSQLSSISAFSIDPKRIQTPHRLFWDFKAEPLQPIGQAAEFKFESQFKPLPPWQT